MLFSNALHGQLTYSFITWPWHRPRSIELSPVRDDGRAHNILYYVVLYPDNDGYCAINEFMLITQH